MYVPNNSLPPTYTGWQVSRLLLMPLAERSASLERHSTHIWRPLTEMEGMLYFDINGCALMVSCCVIIVTDCALTVTHCVICF
jgi:hypothetical protein